jgi:hypothetical protein
MKKYIDNGGKGIQRLTKKKKKKKDKRKKQM